MAIALAQQNQAVVATANSGSVTFVSNTTTTSSIVVIVTGAITATQLVRNITDGTNTYRQVGALNVSGTGSIEIWIAVNITGAVTPTITVVPSGATSFSIHALEISGVGQVQPIDYYTDIFIKANTVGIDSRIPRSPNNIVIFAINQGGVSNTYIVGGGFTNLLQQGTSTTGGGSNASETQINSSSIPIIARFTGASNSVFATAALLVLTDIDLPPVYLTTLLNNYQFLKVGDGMSVSEKIR